MDQSIILGSGSPRRKEILEFFSLPFKQITANFDEDKVPFHGDPAQFSIAVAMGKAVELNKLYPNETILTADTVVYLEGKIYVKPRDLEEAKRMLLELSGKRHQVFTGVVISRGKDFFFEAEETSVEFHELTEAQVETYQKNIHPLDKAGGYAIQKGGCLIVKRIEGCYYNIMGLPLNAVEKLLRKAEIYLWNYLKSI